MIIIATIEILNIYDMNDKDITEQYELQRHQ